MAGNSQQDGQGYPRLDTKAARALSPHVRTVVIESILGGHSPMTHFASTNQYQSSFGIDPSETLNDSTSGTPPLGAFMQPTGLLRPATLGVVAGLALSGTNQAPYWISQEPKTGLTFAYLKSGSSYTTTQSAGGFTALNDGGSLSNSSGNGMEYYDNYMYFAKNTDIARYGPLNGSPTFDATYWTSTLGKTALTNTTYPVPQRLNFNFALPNHPMHRHSDGKLYIGDVVNNQGVLHVISTTKTTVEGDTDNGSTYQKLTFGYGLWPTTIESYGSQLIIGFYEGHPNNTFVSLGAKRGKVAFWDTTSQNFDQITWVEFPDDLITALKNVDGTVYIASGPQNGLGFRISQYVGGYSFKDVIRRYDGNPPYPGALDGDSGRLIMAINSLYPTDNNQRAGVYSVGIGLPGTENKLFHLGGSTGLNYSTAILMAQSVGIRGAKQIFLGFVEVANSTGGIISSPKTIPSDDTADYSLYTRKWASQIYKIGRPFKITKIRIPLAQAVAANMIVTPIIHTDDDYGAGTSLAVINNTNYPGKKNIVIRPENLTGDHNFWLEFQWTGSVLCIINLPIEIDYELIDD